MLDFAKAKGWRDGDNPARWRGHLKNLLPPARSRDSIKHLPAMHYDDVPTFLARLKESQAMAARALEFTILTAARSGEVLGATWPEIDIDNATWTVPANRMKAKEAHVVPLSNAALEVLKPLYTMRQSRFIFPGGRPLKDKGRVVGETGPLRNMSMQMLLRRLNSAHITTHGFRSAFRDWCGDKTEFPREIAEMALAHKIGNKVEQSYRRSSALERRRLLMNTWADFCELKMINNVIPITGRHPTA